MKDAKQWSEPAGRANPAESRSLRVFELGGGSVTGTLHRKAGKPLQDAFGWRRGPRSLVAVVCDGCGSSPHSEVGARLGTRLFCEAIGARLDAGLAVDDPILWQRVRAEVLAELGRLATAMGGAWIDAIADHFLFTVMGAAVTESSTAIIGAGDGVYAINGEVCVLEAGPENRPAYVGYGLLDPGGADSELAIHAVRPTADIDSILLGTDGVTDILSSEHRAVPGRDQHVGAISRFWCDDFLFANRDGVRRRLAVLARDHQTLDWDQRRVDRAPGLLRDDTTIVVLRRAPAGVLS
ncbi:MAG TPA: protein phosphatase 2C domain-containing protein [Kofleriaceae bacterium]|nr:protein phosphatase 2C domain-containing protein [Kofleriaceae bacterium]